MLFIEKKTHFQIVTYFALLRKIAAYILFLVWEFHFIFSLRVSFYFQYGSSILHEAVASGNLSIVKSLLQAKADVNAQTQDERTCLHVAARTGYSGNTEVVKELLKSGADVNVQTRVFITGHLFIVQFKYD